MNKGDKVMIYEDPITEKKEEGWATLVKPVNRDFGGGLERWDVRFDNEPEQTFERTIKRFAARENQYRIEVKTGAETWEDYYVPFLGKSILKAKEFIKQDPTIQHVAILRLVKDEDTGEQIYRFMKVFK